MASRHAIRLTPVIFTHEVHGRSIGVVSPDLKRKLARRLTTPPWRRFPTATRLPLHFDADAMAGLLDRVAPHYWRAHLGPYHDGGWETVSLWAPGGDAWNQTSQGAAFG